MIFRPLMALLGIQNLPNRAQTLAQKVVITFVFVQFIWSLSDTFYVLFVIDTVGYGQLGILLAISLILQSILDYPSGTLGDWIGQKWILFTSFMTFGLSYGLLAVSQTFDSLLIVYCLQAFAASQESGAIMTWFDNNYKVAANEADPKRQTYKFFMGRWRVIGNLVGSIAFVIGGYFATLYFRQTVFFFQGIAFIIMSFSLLFVLNDFPEVVRPKKSIKNYFKLLGEGVKIVFWNKGLFFFVAAICCYGIVWTIWGSMILYPLYFGYTGSDSGASLFRFVVWFIGLPSMFLAANLGSKLEIKWIPRLYFIFSILFFPLFMLLTTAFPIENNEFNPIAIVLTILIFLSTIIFLDVSTLLEQRIFLDFVPDENRNSVYSLVPTLSRIISAPASVIGGIFLLNEGVPSTLSFLGLIGLIGSTLYLIAIHFMPSEGLDQKMAIEESQAQ